MKALVCNQYGPPENLVVNDIPSPTPSVGDVIIDVIGAAVNFPDLLVIENKYQIQPPLPFSPGSEVVGIISAIAEGVEHLKVGDRVIGLCLTGGFREQISISALACIKIPDDISFRNAATLGLAYGTTIYALKDRANIQPQDTLLVTGASGGVGLAAVQIGKAMGATVIAAASSNEKLNICKQHGATHLLKYAKQLDDKESQRNFSKQIKSFGTGGVDVVYDPLGGNYAEPAIRTMNWNGRYLVVGFATGQIPSIPMNLPLLKGCSLSGVFWGEFVKRHPELNQANFEYLFELIRNKALTPHIASVYPLEQTPQALYQLQSRTSSGKILIAVDSNRI